MSALEEKITKILSDSDFDELDKEMQHRINKYRREQKILDYWTILNRYPDDTTKTYKEKLKGALRVIVASFEKDYLD